MPHPLQQKIDALRSRLRRLLAVYGVSWMVGAGLAAMVVLGLADYLIRFRDPGIRVICSLVVPAVLAWTCYRCLYPGLSARLGDVDLARRLQRRFPALGDSLASALEFLKQPEDDPTAGSVALRRAVISETSAQTEPLRFAEVIEKGPAIRAAMAAAGICLLAGILVVLDPPASRIALARLVDPLGGLPWPQKTHLALRRTVNRMARGQTFQVEVIDLRGAKLPREVRIHYRFTGPDEDHAEQCEPMRFVDGAMVARRENVTRPFAYRVEGGDDQAMGWVPVEVVDPPGIESMTLRLIPPPYTAWPVEEAVRQFPVDEAERQLRALVGTQVEIRAKATKPLASAAVCVGKAHTIPGRLAEDGLHLTVPGPSGRELVVREEGSAAYWFELTDRRGLSGGEQSRFEIRAVPDRPPSVSIERPIGTVFVTPRAVVPLRVTAKDDLALQAIDLIVERADASEQGKPQALRLYAGAPVAQPLPGGGLAGGAELG